jgi:hypothetical protein
MANTTELRLLAVVEVELVGLVQACLLVVQTVATAVLV